MILKYLTFKNNRKIHTVGIPLAVISISGSFYVNLKVWSRLVLEKMILKDLSH
jgi:hypothetical protein